MWFSPAQGKSLNNSAPFATVAVAGHVPMGDAYCKCGGAYCICDPGETAHTSQVSESTANGSSALSDNGASIDPAAGVMLLTLALLLGLRMRF